MAQHGEVLKLSAPADGKAVWLRVHEAAPRSCCEAQGRTMMRDARGIPIGPSAFVGALTVSRGHSRTDPRRIDETGGRLPSEATRNVPICRVFTGATGLEPATSGVTGHFETQDR
jgi:hypothetical protein